MMADQIYKDSIRTPEERAKSLLEEMSLDEKMAQAAGVFPFGEDYHVYCICRDHSDSELDYSWPVWC